MLRDINKTFITERLENLKNTLIYVAKNAQNLIQLEEFLREIHTLKRDSRILGISDVETIVHYMEDTMIEVKRGRMSLTVGICDRLHNCLDAVRLLVKEAVTGESSEVNTFLVLAELIDAQESLNGNSTEPLNSEDDQLFEDEDLFRDYGEPEIRELVSSFANQKKKLMSLCLTSMRETQFCENRIEFSIVCTVPLYPQ